MKTCDNCGEIIGTYATDCFKCHKEFKVPKEYKGLKKLCPRCSLIYSWEQEICEKCGGSLNVYDAQYDRETVSKDIIFISAIIPLYGLIKGIEYINDGDTSTGVSLILASTVFYLFITIIAFFIFNVVL